MTFKTQKTLLVIIFSSLNRPQNLNQILELFLLFLSIHEINPFKVIISNQIFELLFLFLLITSFKWLNIKVVDEKIFG